MIEVEAEGKPAPAGGPLPRAEIRLAGATFFGAAGIPLLRGHTFPATEAADSGLLAIINQKLADVLFPNEDPVGKRIAWRNAGITDTRGDWRTIIGVAGSIQDGAPDAEPRPAVYVLYGPWTGDGLAIRAQSGAAALSVPVTQIVRRISPNALIEDVMTIAQYKDKSVAPRRLNAVLVSAFGILAVIIAAVGIAGVLAFSVSARTNEIGIRMSLGADAGRVQRMILREGGSLVALGVGLGIASAFASAGVMRRLLFGIAPHDTVTFIGVSVTMAAIGIVACWIPALRAARIDPAIAMRSE